MTSTDDDYRIGDVIRLDSVTYVVDSLLADGRIHLVDTGTAPGPHEPARTADPADLPPRISWRDRLPDDPALAKAIADSGFAGRQARAILDRCTCSNRDNNHDVLTGHEPSCSLQSSGWLT